MNDLRLSFTQIKQLEASLIGALRREEMAEIAVRRLEAEIKHMNHLVSLVFLEHFGFVV